MNQPADVSIWTSRPEVYPYLENGIGYLALNRPKALNALSGGMVRAMKDALQTWRDDPAVLAVVVYSPHPRAFCAGGDIRFLYDSYQRDEHAAIDAFFVDEYRLNHLIFTYPKPYIALMNGVVMGGGMGISQAARHTGGMRIVGASARLAMPETKIGLFPDVGISWFLARTPGWLGTYLGVSGNLIHAPDAVYAGLADVLVPDAALPALLESLQATRFQSAAEITAHLHAQTRALSAAGESDADANAKTVGTLQQHRVAIDRHFSQPDMATLIASLDLAAQSAPAGDTWASQTAAELRTRSPLSMAVSLELIRRARSLSMAEVLRTDLDLVATSFSKGDVIEGIRCVIVDKDQAPRWNPASIEALSAQTLESMFVSRWDAAQNPLVALKD
jgi:enoyl-CoA hydratase/carnithine racemase